MHEIKYSNADMSDMNWTNSRLKYNCDIFGRIGFRGYTKEDIVDEGEGAISLSPSNIKLDKLTLDDSTFLSWKKYHESPEIKVYFEDLIFVKTGSSIGKVAYVSECGNELTINPQLIVLKNIKTSKFIYYVMLSEGFRSQLFSQIPASTIPNISQEKIGNLAFKKPVGQEQQKIANFLDIKTAQFDSIISKKEQLIEKLEEAKKSLISEVVTGKVKIVDGKLVKRDASEMKDSGVEWLGMIPNEWEVKSIKHISDCYPSNVDKKSKSNEKEVILCNYTDVYYNDYITNNNEFMKATATPAQIQKFKLCKGDIILTKDSESPDDIGIASYVDETIEDLVCGYHLTLIKANNDINRLFLYYFLLSSGVRNYFETVANGVTRYGIGIAGFLNLKVVIPEINEQKVIAEFIRGELEKNSKIHHSILKQIELLKHAKQSLTSEAVTGKIDLRDWEIIEEGELQ